MAAEVAPVELIGAKGGDSLARGGEAKIGIDDGEDAGLADEGEQDGRDDVDAGEGQREWRVLGRPHDFIGSVTLSAADEEILFVEEELAGGLALLDGKGGEGS